MKKTTICKCCAVFFLLLYSAAEAHPPNGKGIDAPSVDLPPIVPGNEYVASPGAHFTYTGPALEIVLTNVELQPFASLPPSYLPDGEHQHFESQVSGEVSVNGSPAQQFSLTGPIDTVAYGKCPSCITGTFDTEMLAMSLVGNTPFGPVFIRESPTRPSTGTTSITDIGGGLYHIDSFFDVFTELSIDGGQTWMPSNVSDGPSHPTRLYLGGISEPTSIMLLGLALFGVSGLTRRR